MNIIMNNVRTIILYLAIIMSIASQVNSISGIARILMHILWVCTILSFTIQHKGVVRISRFTQIFVVLYCLYFLFCISCSVLFGTHHLNSNYLYLMLIPAFMTIVGDIGADFIDNNILQNVCKVYFVSAIVFSIWVQINYFPTYSSFMNQISYVFRQKNSAAQIWSSAILINMFLLKYKSKWARVISLFFSFYMLLLIAMSQCRTAMLALGVISFFYLLLYAKHKIRKFALIVISVLFALQFELFRDFLSQALSLNRYNGMDLNTFSSGRLDLWADSLHLFKVSQIIGIGRYYVDNSYISILVESGIIGFLIIESIWVSRIIYNIKKFSNGTYGKFLLCITLYYMVTSVLEGYSPFGPGVSSFMFWFLSMVLTKSKKSI